MEMQNMFLSARKAVVVLCAFAHLTTAEYPSYQLSNVDFADLVTMDHATVLRIANILTTDGAMQINGISYTLDYKKVLNKNKIM